MENERVVTGPEELVQIRRVASDIGGVGPVSSGRQVGREDVRAVHGEVNAATDERVVDFRLQKRRLIECERVGRLPVLVLRQRTGHLLDDPLVELDRRSGRGRARGRDRGDDEVGSALRIKRNLSREAHTLVRIWERLVLAIVLQVAHAEDILAGLEENVDRLLFVSVALRDLVLEIIFVDNVKLEINVNAMGRDKGAEVARLSDGEGDRGLARRSIETHVVANVDRVTTERGFVRNLVERGRGVRELARNETMLVADRLHHDGRNGKGERVFGATAKRWVSLFWFKDLQSIDTLRELQALDLIAVVHVITKSHDIGVIVEDTNNKIGPDEVKVDGGTQVNEVINLEG